MLPLFILGMDALKGTFFGEYMKNYEDDNGSDDDNRSRLTCII